MQKWQLEQRQSLPLDIKIVLAKRKITEWYEFWEGDVYVSFSGGKDSTVLLHLVRELYPEVPAVFSNTGLEYPEIVNFVRSVENVTWIKPEMSFREVIDKYGYPVVSKEQAQFIREARTTNSDKLRDIRLNGNRWGRGKVSKKWVPLLTAPFMVSEKCCEALKKRPFKRHEKETERKPFIGTMAAESTSRATDWVRYGCNAFESKRPMSKPLSVWTDSDVWEYLKRYQVPYSKIYDKGYSRTGCMFCAFGVNQEGTPNRFQRMKETHPKQYSYCMEKLNMDIVLNYINVDFL